MVHKLHSMTSTHYDSLIGYLQIRRGTFTLTVCESSQPYSTTVYVSVVCIHFTIFLRFIFTAAPASLTVVRKRTDYTRNESSRELSFMGAKVPTGNFRSK